MALLGDLHIRKRNYFGCLLPFEPYWFSSLAVAVSSLVFLLRSFGIYVLLRFYDNRIFFIVNIVITVVIVTIVMMRKSCTST